MLWPRKNAHPGEARPLTTLLVTHPACSAHDMGEGHPERPQRLRAVDQALEDETFQLLARDVAPRAAIEALTRVHPLDYIEAIRRASPTQGAIQLDSDTAMSPGTLEAALRSAGGATFAVDEVVGAASTTPLSPQGRPATTPKRRRRWASASSTTQRSPPGTPKRPMASSVSPSSISTSTTATAPRTSSGAIRP